MDRKHVSSGTKWETKIGYSRALRVGSHVYVSGTTSTNMDGKVVNKGAPYDQTVQAIKNIERALEEAGATLQDVVRTRMFVTSIYNWEEIGKAHGDMFKDINPTTSMVEVKRLIEPEMLVEIEAEAYITE